MLLSRCRMSPCTNIEVKTVTQENAAGISPQDSNVTVRTSGSPVASIRCTPTLSAINSHVTPGVVRDKGVKAALAELERASIEEALRAENGNRTRAARNLGISLRSLLYKIEKYGVGR